MKGVQVEETDSWQEGAETWRVLRAYFPGSIDTHSLIQDFFFDDDLKLRRYDYNANLAGGFGASQFGNCSFKGEACVGVLIEAWPGEMAECPPRRSATQLRVCITSLGVG